MRKSSSLEQISCESINKGTPDLDTIDIYSQNSHKINSSDMEVVDDRPNNIAERHGSGVDVNITCTPKMRSYGTDDGKNYYIVFYSSMYVCNLIFLLDFKKVVLSELSFLHLKVNSLIDKIDDLIKLRRRDIPNYDAIERNMFEKLPIRDEVKLAELENWLQTQENYKLMVSI